MTKLVLWIYEVLTEINGFTYFTTIVSTTTEDSDCVVCVVEDIETCVVGSSDVKV